MSIFNIIILYILNIGIFIKANKEEANKYIKCTPSKDIDIFLIADQDFKNNRKNKAYKILADYKELLKKQYDIELLYTKYKNDFYSTRYFYSGLSKIFYIWKNYFNNLKKYVGFNHYNKNFIFLDCFPDFDNIFNEHDIIINKPTKLNKIKFRKETSKILDLLINLIKEELPDYYKSAVKLKKQGIIYQYNTFIMKKDDFKHYGNFIFRFILILHKKYDVIDNISLITFIKKMFDNTEDDFIKMAPNFIFETLTSIFYITYFKSPLYINIIGYEYGNFNDKEEYYNYIVNKKNDIHFQISKVNLLKKYLNEKKKLY